VLLFGVTTRFAAYWLGELPVVAVVDYQTMVDSFQKEGDAYSGRPKFLGLHTMFRGGALGVIMTDDDLWRDQRRFALHVLRDFGLGKNLMQDKILVEVNALIEKIGEGIDAQLKEHNIATYVDRAVGSIINSLLFNYRFFEVG